MTELRLSDNPAWEGDKGNTKGDKHDDLQRARFICPVVGLEMNGRHRSVWLNGTGTLRTWATAGQSRVLQGALRLGRASKAAMLPRRPCSFPVSHLYCGVQVHSRLSSGLMYLGVGEPAVRRDFKNY